jgi:thioredoxin reductase
MNIIILGAGIAGLSSAHFLIKRGYKVTIIESLSIPGGMARSERVPDDKNMPSEYSWRGFGPWYHNTYDVMKEIPIDNKTVYDTELSHPIQFLLTSDDNKYYDDVFSNSHKISKLDKYNFFWEILKVYSSCKDRRKEYSSINASEYISKFMSTQGAKTISQTFGPWVGSDSSRVSFAHVSDFFMRNAYPCAKYNHEANESGPSFYIGGGTGWSILRRPSNESWFDPWVTHLKSLGVIFKFNTELTKINLSNNKIINITVKNNGIFTNISADKYIFAINPYNMNEIIKKTPLLLKDIELSKFEGLTNDSPHVQISFRIAFSEKIHLKHTNNPGVRTAIILIDSEFDLTLFSQDELFKPDVYLGDNIKSLWSGTATRDFNSGSLYNLPMSKLTKKQFTEEIKHQIFRSKGLNELVKKNNNGKNLSEFPIIRIEIWHTWKFQPQPDTSIVTDPTQPKWVNNTTNNAFFPNAKTSISNLFLAGAHTNTNTNLYSMEAAVESGRRAADIISNKETVILQKIPPIIKLIRCLDSILYYMGLPNAINVIVLIVFIIILLIIYKISQHF